MTRRVLTASIFGNQFVKYLYSRFYLSHTLLRVCCEFSQKNKLVYMFALFNNNNNNKILAISWV